MTLCMPVMFPCAVHSCSSCSEKRRWWNSTTATSFIQTDSVQYAGNTCALKVFSVRREVVRSFHDAAVLACCSAESLDWASQTQSGKCPRLSWSPHGPSPDPASEIGAQVLHRSRGLRILLGCRCYWSFGDEGQRSAVRKAMGKPCDSLGPSPG